VSAERFDLLVVGELNPDAILLGEELVPAFGQVEQLVDDGTLTIGSSGAITACGAARLGMRTAYVGVVGDDASGRFMLEELRRRKVDVDACRVDPERPTGLTVVLSRGDDRAILTATGAMAGLTPADVADELLTAASHVHVSSPHLQAGLGDGLRELLGRAGRAGAGTSLDPGWDPRGEGDGVVPALEAVEILLPNAAEARRLTGAGDDAGALDALAQRVETVVVKRGAEGAIARRGDETVSVEAPPLTAIDTTGAGDNLTAGLLYGIASGLTVTEALRLGVACGSLSTRGLGGVAAQPELGEAEALARTLTVRGTERSRV
jgi:sugar/nucleoside kinase (ribokinase family)